MENIEKQITPELYREFAQAFQNAASLREALAQKSQSVADNARSLSSAGVIPLDTEHCASAFASLSNRNSVVLAEIGKQIEKEADEAFPGLTLYIAITNVDGKPDFKEDDFSKFISSLPVRKEMPIAYALGLRTQPDSDSDSAAAT